jgi:hypothetical protein
MTKSRLKTGEKLYNRLLKQVESALGKKPTTNFQLNKYCRKKFGHQYKGTFARNQIPIMNHNEFCIANLDTSNEPGSHWIAIIKHHDKYLIYDSYGRDLSKILPNFNKKYDVISTEQDAEQSDSATNCGPRCIAALGVYNMLGSKAFLQI